MDYFNADALPLSCKALMKKYQDNGVNLTALYSDEMHIQQDWGYFGHHEGGQFAERYLTREHGRCLVPKNSASRSTTGICSISLTGRSELSSLPQSAVVNVQYVMGPILPRTSTGLSCCATAITGCSTTSVVDLFCGGQGAMPRELFGRELRHQRRTHRGPRARPSTYWNYRKAVNGSANQYEYTSNFVWGNTVHQAAAACYDYFKWSEYLQPTGQRLRRGRLGRPRLLRRGDGRVDRAWSTSTRCAYAAAWGMPAEVCELEDGGQRRVRTRKATASRST